MRFQKCQHLFEKKGIFLILDFWLDKAVFSAFLKNAQKNLYFLRFSFLFSGSFSSPLHPYLMQAVFKSFLPCFFLR